MILCSSLEGACFKFLFKEEPPFEMLSRHKKEHYVKHSLCSAFALQRGWRTESQSCLHTGMALTVAKSQVWQECSSHSAWHCYSWEAKNCSYNTDPSPERLWCRLPSWPCFRPSFSAFLPGLPETDSHPTPVWVTVPLPHVFFNCQVSSLSFLPDSEALLPLDTPTTYILSSSWLASPYTHTHFQRSTHLSSSLTPHQQSQGKRGLWGWWDIPASLATLLG